MNNSNQNQNQNNNDQMNPLVGGIISLVFWLSFTVIGFKVNPVMYIFGLFSIAIAGQEFREWYDQKNK